MSTFNWKLKNKILNSKKNLCIGLDPDIHLIPEGYKKNIEGIYDFLKDIIHFTFEDSIAYKINLAFFECLGLEGWKLLVEILKDLRNLSSQKNQQKIVIADAKRGDIENTSLKYAEAFFNYYQFDAITIHPYMGSDSVLPFIQFKNKGCIILCLTSNSSNLEFQFYGNPPLYEIVAKKIVDWNQHYDNVMAVVGATNKEEYIKNLSILLKDIPILVPGIGAQGGSLEVILKYFKNHALINVSRTILYASTNREFMQEKINDYIKNYYKKIYKYI